MFRFGWLTIAADDLAVWEQYPDAAFALVKTAAMTATNVDTEVDVAEEFHLGTFGLPEKSTLEEH
jgi:hypothetical protein